MAVVARPPANERPALAFSQYGVVFHFLYRDKAPPRATDRLLDSIERDVLAYAYRDVRPFHSDLVPVRAGVAQVSAVFPRAVEYLAEGADRALVTRDEDLTGPDVRERRFKLCVARTVFDGGRGVLHLGLAPLAGGGDAAHPDSVLNEYDLIKLAKLWDGGEGVSPEDGPRAMARQVRFGVADGQALVSIQELARGVLSDARLLASDSVPDLRAGTIQLLHPFWPTLAATLTVLRSDGGEASDGFSADALGDDWKPLVGLQGVLCGLLDVDHVDEAEMRDSFLLPMYRAADAMLAVNKGTLLAVGEECRLQEAMGDRVAVNPYLLLVHAVLAQNEAVLRAAAGRARAAERDPREAELRDTAAAMRQALLEHHLPNIFHYERERDLYEQGSETRRLAELRADVERRLTRVESLIEGLRDGRERSVRAFLELFVLILTILQVVGNFEQLHRLATNMPWAFLACAVATVIVPLPIYWIANRQRKPVSPFWRLVAILLMAAWFWGSLYLWLRYLIPDAATP